VTETSTDAHAFDPMAPLRPTGNLRRRQLVSRLLVVLAMASAALAVAALGLVTFEVAHHGASVLSVGFVTHNASGFGGGGIAAELVGTALIALFGALIAVPIGVLIAIYLSEFAGPGSRVAATLKLVLDLMQGLPTIIVGLLVFSLLVYRHHTSGIAGSIALSIVMLPLIARSSQEVMLLVPNSLREAADALGVARWRAVLTVILPTALGGIATGAILSIARAAGETAPVLVLDSLYNFNATGLNPFHGVPNIPMYIETVSDQANPQAYALCWGAATVLLVTILVANVLARVSLARSRAKMGL
jgi:phosphate transport system permease protein